MNLTCTGRLPLIADFVIAMVRVDVGLSSMWCSSSQGLLHVPALISIDLLIGTLIKAPQQVTIPPFDRVPQLFENQRQRDIRLWMYIVEQHDAVTLD
jgi:hypothetical protein